MMRRTFPRIAASPVSYTAVGQSCASSRKCCWHWRLAIARGARHPTGCLPLERRSCGLCGVGARPQFHAGNAQPFEVALAATRAGNLFTTHTAVTAGFDRFTPALIEQYLGHYATDKLGISLYDLLALGRQNPNDASKVSTWRIWPFAAAVRRMA